MCSVGSSSQSLRSGLLAVAWPAKAFKVRIVIGAAMRLGLDVVYGGSSYGAPIAQTFQAQVIVTLQDTLTPDCPVVAVSSLVSALTLLVSLPASVLMFIAVARAVCRSVSASAFATCLWCSRWHAASFGKDALSMALAKATCNADGVSNPRPVGPPHGRPTCRLPASWCGR